ncbi:PREDICTED: serine-enriched protein-like [Priapulus caudatus]|uniref:Serine-enriched protein-like n=1 Tax=Priapulus caudatus TaxID=37621 RepID=A0ABM1EZT5_PRICU|nr:PREDICTED: serine-enriched protein-like [Priapulus caudatus]
MMYDKQQETKKKDRKSKDEKVQEKVDKKFLREIERKMMKEKEKEDRKSTSAARKFFRRRRLTNAADYFGLDELKKTCIGFVNCCINVDTACALLSSAEEYMHYKSTKCLVQKVLEFVDTNGDHILSLPAFALLPQHVVKLALSREELQADELTKFHAALLWSRKHCEQHPDDKVKDTMTDFLDLVAFHKIPAAVLMREVHPSGVVPDSVVMNALAYQADPTSVDLTAVRPRPRARPGMLLTQHSMSRLSIHDGHLLGAANAQTAATETGHHR